MLIALIPARGGSVRLPRKNLMRVGGLSLVARAIAVARSLSTTEIVPVVSTDDPAIATEAQLHGALVHHRSPVEADGKHHRALVGQLVLQWWEESPAPDAVHEIAYDLRQILHALPRVDPEAVLLLQPTSPLRTALTVENALSLYRRTRADCVVSVSPVPHSKIHSAGVLDPHSQRWDATKIASHVAGSQPAPVTYAPDGVVWVTRPATLRQGDWYGPATYAVPSNPIESVDIDTAADLHIARALHAFGSDHMDASGGTYP